jgi:hypothetical protein
MPYVLRTARIATTVTAAALGLGACAGRTASVELPVTAVAEAAAPAPTPCARPAVLVRNLAQSAVYLYKAKGTQRTFVAEVPAGGASQHIAEPAASYYLRPGRGLGTGIEPIRPVTGMAEQARIDRVCLDS